MGGFYNWRSWLTQESVLTQGFPIVVDLPNATILVRDLSEVGTEAQYSSGISDSRRRSPNIWYGTYPGLSDEGKQEDVHKNPGNAGCVIWMPSSERST